LRSPYLVVKSIIIGTIVGMIPGTGASIASFVSYGELIRSSDEPETYGTGNPKGIIAAESANNATVPGAIIPTLAFGIPGSGTTAVVLGALILHGVRPGSRLFGENAQLTATILISLVATGVLILIIGIFFMSQLSAIVTVDANYIIPMIIFLSVMGAFSAREFPLDILTVFVFGLFGFYLAAHNYSLITLILGLILGPIAERSFRRALVISGGDPAIFVQDPLAIFLVAMLVIALAYPFLQRLRTGGIGPPG
ncbi:MAG: tripartite tricarboxylate transporter permease, partial [Halobacteriales archaeon]|nr:tripartite tricarboxylate transporter permease [Halobacteriales archaeon]